MNRVLDHFSLCDYLGTGELVSFLVRRETRISDCCRLRASRAHSAIARVEPQSGFRQFQDSGTEY